MVGMKGGIFITWLRTRRVLLIYSQKKSRRKKVEVDLRRGKTCTTKKKHCKGVKKTLYPWGHLTD